MYEHKQEKLLDKHAFGRRVAAHFLAASSVLIAALGIGVAGYHYFAGLTWLDSLLNASMILGGMGPVNPLASPAAKLFASFYALFSGLVFVGIASVMVAPFAHRLLHGLHLDEEKQGATKPG